MMKKSLPKQKYSRRNLRLPTESLNRVEELAIKKRVSVNTLIASAIELYLGEKDDTTKNNPYLLSLSRTLKSLKFDVELVGELVSYFTFHWFCYTPEIPESQKKALWIEGKKRHETFLKLLSNKLHKGGSALSLLSPYETPEEESDTPEEDKKDTF